MAATEVITAANINTPSSGGAGGGQLGAAMNLTGLVAAMKTHVAPQYSTSMQSVYASGAPSPLALPLPRALVAGPTLAYRLWQVQRMPDVGLRLMSLSSNAWMHPGEPTAAVCTAHAYSTMLDYETWKARHAEGAPSADCTCGWYAVKDRSCLSSDGGPKRTIVGGVVALWGRVIEHEHGYRAQYAYPVRLWRQGPSAPLPPGFPVVPQLDDMLAQLAALYGCEVGERA